MRIGGTYCGCCAAIAAAASSISSASASAAAFLRASSTAGSTGTQLTGTEPFTASATRTSGSHAPTSRQPSANVQLAAVGAATAAQ